MPPGCLIVAQENGICSSLINKWRKNYKKEEEEIPLSS